MSVAFEPFEAEPSRIGLLVTVVPAAVAVAALAATPLALGVAAVGGAVVLGGTHAGSRRIVTVGTIALFGAALLAGVQGASILQVGVAAGAAVVAWDAGVNAIGVATQLGANADTSRLLVAHALATSVVAALVGGGAIATYYLSRSGQPTLAVALLLLAAFLFVLLLDR